MNKILCGVALVSLTAPPQLCGELAMREMALSIDRAYRLPAEQRRSVLDAMDEPVPQEYQDAVRRYFQQLSEAE